MNRPLTYFGWYHKYLLCRVCVVFDSEMLASLPLFALIKGICWEGCCWWSCCCCCRCWSGMCPNIIEDYVSVQKRFSGQTHNIIYNAIIYHQMRRVIPRIDKGGLTRWQQCSSARHWITNQIIMIQLRPIHWLPQHIPGLSERGI